MLAKGNVLVTLGVATVAAAAGLAVYVLVQELKPKDDDEDEKSGQKKHSSSRQTSLEIIIDEKDAGLIIGRRGENIRELERRTNTKIHFKDECESS